MNTSSTVQSHIDITDTMARLYLFLAQSLDRCVSEAARISYPEPQFQASLASTRATMLDMSCTKNTPPQKWRATMKS